MKDEDIHVGDVVRIRSFEDMKSEFGVDRYGDIPGYDSVSFVAKMQELCGAVFTVAYALNQDDYGWDYRSVEGIEGLGEDDNFWSIRAWMLEPYEEDTEWEVADDNQIALLLS